VADTPASAPTEPAQEPTLLRDLLVLTKFRLSALVIVTTFVGFWLNRGDSLHISLLLHTIIGSTLAAFGAAVFNQLMEIEPDSRMTRTADRPLPAGRISPATAFGLGWFLSALSLIHLARMVNAEAAMLTAATLAVYLFLYTPLKQQSALNTIVGAVSGALPPLIGWAGAAGAPPEDAPYFRWRLLLEPGAIYLFALLFLWQLPHFLAINWMYRDEYRRGGFVMWANEDEGGGMTAGRSLFFATATLLLMFYPVMTGIVAWWFLVPALALAVWLCWLAWRFFKVRDRPSARKLFFCTLAYLPVVLILTALAWKH
jgi:protoheme IX farnesyltransferase